jgi:predicted nucleic acid-binding protein
MMITDSDRSIFFASLVSFSFEKSLSTIETNSLFFPQKVIKCLPENQKKKQHKKSINSNLGKVSCIFIYFGGGGGESAERTSWENYAEWNLRGVKF